MLVGALYNSQKGNNKGVRHLMKVKKKKKKFYLYNRMLFSPEKELSTSTHYLHEPWTHFAKREKAATTDHILYYFFYVKYTETGE